MQARIFTVAWLLYEILALTALGCSGRATEAAGAVAASGAPSGASGAKAGGNGGAAAGANSSGGSTNDSGSAGVVGLAGAVNSGGASAAGGGDASIGSAGNGGRMDSSSGGADVGSGGAPADSCSSDADCPGGACWLGLNGARACVTAPANVLRTECMASDSSCCTADTQCTQGAGGRCTARPGGPCGGAVPFGNACSYDTCTSDMDCRTLGGSLAVCVPPGALSMITAGCVSGACRTNADCKLHPGGQCTYGPAATHNGMCDVRSVFFCAYPSDPCQGFNTGCQSLSICLPNENFDGRSCNAPPPMYP